MKVATQFIAWKVAKKVTVPEGRCELRYPMYCCPKSKNVLSTQSYRPLRDGSPFWTVPGNKLPGYLHSVP